jgi:hypothetical protein
MHYLIRLSSRLIAAFAFFASVLAAFRKTPMEDRDPKAVASEIGKLLEAEKQRSGTDWASNLRRARAFYRRRKWEPSQRPVT